MRRSFEVRGRPIAPDAPLFVLAEIGLNHGGDVSRALSMVDAAAGAGAAAVKLQTLRADALVASSCPAPAHVSATSLREFFARFELDETAHRQVADRAHARGLAFLSTPLDERAVDLLVAVGADALKIASGDITHHRLIARAARTGLPLLMSTGMSEEREVVAAVACAESAGASAVALLHCVSAYPVPAGSENLGVIRRLAARFPGPVGLSDHGTDAAAVPIAVALGASLYERHLALPDDEDAVDRAVSSTPAELAAIVAAAERARRAIGHGRRECLPAEAPNVVPSRRGLYAARPLPAGTCVTADDIVCLRPVVDIPADDWQSVLGCRLVEDVPAGAPIRRGLLARDARP